MKRGFSLLFSALLVLEACASDNDAGYTDGMDAGVSPDASVRPDSSVALDGSVSSDANGSFDVPFPSFPDAGVRDAAPKDCTVEVYPITAPTLLGLPAGRDASVRLRGAIEGEPRPPSPQWDWNVSVGGVAVAVQPDPENPAVVTLPLPNQATYDITVRVSPTCASRPIQVTAVARQQRSTFFIVRVVPPPQSGLPPQDIVREMLAGVSKTEDVPLAPGPDVAIIPRRLQGAPPAVLVPSFVRITSRTSTFEREGTAATAAGFATKLGIGTYDVLVVPQDENLPPLLWPPVDVKALRPLYIDIDAGVLVQGHVMSQSQPLAGARLMLRKGASGNAERTSQPSTLGTSAADGSFTLRARAGQHTLRVVPPADSVLPTLQVPASSPLILSSDASTVSLAVDYAPMQSASLNLTVNQPDGVSPASNTVVVIKSVSSLPAVASVRLAQGVAQSVPGQVELVRQTDEAGNVSVANLARGEYHVILRPPAGRPWPAAFQTPIKVNLSGGDVTATVNLSAAIRASGTLLLSSESPAGLRMAAHAKDDPDVEDVYANVGADGSFTWMLSPNTSYEMRVEPPPGRLIPRVILGSIAVKETEYAIGSLPAVPASLRFGGRVLNNGAPVPGTVLQAFCMDKTSSCIDFSSRSVGAALPISEAVADHDGSFTLVLPDPGSL